MTLEDQIKLRFEAFVFHPSNADNDDLKRCKNANAYFFDNKTGINITCTMMLKIHKQMYNILPPSNHVDYEKQFSKMNDIIRECKEALKLIENLKS